jgi:site-specific recombinase XerD
VSVFLTTNHSFGHHFASQLLQAGASVADVQMLLGHAPVASTTKVYWHANTEGLAEVYARFVSGRRPLRLVGPDRDQAQAART